VDHPEVVASARELVGDATRMVGRSVVDDEYRERYREAAEGLDQAGEVLGLVVGGEHDDGMQAAVV
jgi:hypothetical protein